MNRNTSKTMAIIKLQPAIQYAFPEVVNMFYYIEQDTKEEYVHVNFVQKAIHTHLLICVTADSIPAMYDDVWRTCKRRFG